MTEINKLYILKLLEEAKALVRLDHGHLPNGFGGRPDTDGCEFCKRQTYILNHIEVELGEDPRTAKTTEDFIRMIQTDPLSKRLFEMGRKYQADKWAEEKEALRR